MKGFVFLCSLIVFSACAKSSGSSVCNNVTPDSEEPAILSYCASAGITPVKDPSGLYYQIITPGIAPMPDLNDSISVVYEGKLLDGTIFGSTTTATAFASLSAFIDGWKIGLQKIGKGGQIKMVIPSSLAYGCQGYYTIQPNTVLYFSVTMVDVKPMP